MTHRLPKSVDDGYPRVFAREEAWNTRPACLVPPWAAAQAHSGWGAVEDRQWLPRSRGQGRAIVLTAGPHGPEGGVGRLPGLAGAAPISLSHNALYVGLIHSRAVSSLPGS